MDVQTLAAAGHQKQWGQSPSFWYGFDTDEQAAEYPHTPLKKLGLLAKNKIAILSVVGHSDDVVPVEENTAVTEKLYKVLGGVFEAIHKPGVGHHPHGLDDQRSTNGNTWTLWFPANAPKVLFPTNKDAPIGNGGSCLYRLV